MTKYNSFTGMPLKEDDDLEFNSLTGDYFQRNKKSNDIEKSDEPKWPSISKRQVADNDSDSKQVEKSNFANFSDSIHRVLGGSNTQSIKKSISMDVPIVHFEKKGDEHLVYGIVYEPDTVDAQGDQASAEEIEKAANLFMENHPQFKIQHKGKAVNVKVLQSFIAPVDYTIAKRKVKKGSWVMVTRINDEKLWKAIKEGKFTGYSMAGYAKVD